MFRTLIALLFVAILSLYSPMPERVSSENGFAGNTGVPFVVGAACAESAAIGGVFPDIALPSVRGASRYGLPEGGFSLYKLSHRVVVLNLYSWFCGPCRAEAPLLVALQERIVSSGLEDDVLLLGIATGDDKGLVRKFRDTYGVTYPLIPDPDLQLHAETGAKRIPFMYVLQRKAGKYMIAAAREGAPEGDARSVLEWILRSAHK